ncbi:hypothetical protein [Bacillus niameyensis]|uniref:hypothetical protein n=1 Tax=Bacillus niameyensis TaxID=1522308 RepID=UPI0007857A45|nr:hypothetical protein [Bacillus niameyensis]
MIEQKNVQDHGIPVQAQESRTAAICINSDGEERFVIAAKGFLMILDLETGKATQVFFPEKYVEYPFASFSSKSGLFYTGAGKMLIVLDPFKEKVIDYKWNENGEEIIGFSFAEDRKGNIYCTTYPHCHLLQYIPESRSIIDYGSMDPTEKYAGSLAVDLNGWIYMGVGTERKDIIAFQPATGKKQSLVADQERTRGTGFVYQGTDGGVYGHWEAETMQTVNHAFEWYTFSNGYLEKSKGRAPSHYSGLQFKRIHRNGARKYTIAEFSLSEGYVICKSSDGEQKQVDFTYRSDGAVLSPLYKGPDDCLYGTSQHPLQFFKYDFEEMQNYGPIERGGGGNICAYASQGMKMIGFAYAGGKIYEFDLNKPIAPKAQNPILISEHESIHRPRCAVSHSDGKHIVWGGFPGYGMTGGGLGIYHVGTKEIEIIPHTAIVPNQSTICLGILRSGDVLGGTSIDTPGGASSKEKTGALYYFNWSKKQVEYVLNPISDSREISQLFIDCEDQAHCLTVEGVYFIFNPTKGLVSKSIDLSKYGTPVRSGFTVNEQRTKLYGLFSKTIIMFDLESHAEPAIVTTLEIAATSGIAFKDGRIYYGSGSRLLSVEVEESW